MNTIKKISRKGGTILLVTILANYPIWVNGQTEPSTPPPSESATPTTDKELRNDVTIIKQGKMDIYEVRNGGRLEEVQVKHKNGLTEYYENRNNSDQWSGAEKELGEVENTRRWKLFKW